MREKLSLPGIKVLFIVFILAIVIGGLSLFYGGISLIVFPICFLIAFSFPSLMWVSYVYSKDIHTPEPGRNVLIALTWGMISTIPAMIINSWAATFLSFTLVAVMIAPIGEELLKPLGLTFLKPDINNELDGVIYGVSCGMGFALIENLNYELTFVLIQLFPNTFDPEMLGVTWTETLWSLGSLARGLGSTIIHALGAGFIGFAYARYMNKKGTSETILVMAYLAAIAVHAAWNGVASTEIDVIAIPFMFTFPILAFLILRYLVHEARRCEEQTIAFTAPREARPIGGKGAREPLPVPSRPTPDKGVPRREDGVPSGDNMPLRFPEIERPVPRRAPPVRKFREVKEAPSSGVISKTEDVELSRLLCPRCEMNFRPPRGWDNQIVQCPFCGMSFKRASS